MNTLISFELKVLLFKKGFRYELSHSYDPELGGTRVNHSLAEQRWNEGDLTYVDITIADVVMWLYEKHGIWVSVKTIKWNYEHNTIRFNYNICKFNHNNSSDITDVVYDFNSPTEAYEAAIEYTLKNLI